MKINPTKCSLEVEIQKNFPLEIFLLQDVMVVIALLISGILLECCQTFHVVFNLQGMAYKILHVLLYHREGQR